MKNSESKLDLWKDAAGHVDGSAAGKPANAARIQKLHSSSAAAEQKKLG